MINNLKYSTQAIKTAIKVDKDISQEVKDKEDKKMILTDDAFALCDYLNQIKEMIWRIK